MNEVKKVDQINDFRDAKVGDLVTCLIRGKAVIEKVNISGEFPILVRYQNNNSQDYYTLNGSLEIYANKTLYKGHVDFKIEVIKPKVKRYSVAYQGIFQSTALITSTKWRSIDEFWESGDYNKNEIIWAQLIEASMELCDE